VQHSKDEIQKTLQLAHNQFERCDLESAFEGFKSAYDKAIKKEDIPGACEALRGIIRYSAEALNHSLIKQWVNVLKKYIADYPSEVPAVTWYTLATVHLVQFQWKTAKKYTLRFLKEVREENWDQPRQKEAAIAKGRSALCHINLKQGHYDRAQYFAKALLNVYEEEKYRGINGSLYMVLGLVHETKGHLDRAIECYRKAHGTYLEEHNWYHYLYVIYAYARIARKEKNYSRAYWHLDMISRAAQTPGFGRIQQEIRKEKEILKTEAIDLLVDARNGIIQTRENSKIQLGKQYVLLDILEALSSAHEKSGADKERGLSKAEIISAVWKEKYRPESHDNKLYYNINRLRKMIEPNIRKPRYVLNWKEGYRLAPGLKIQFLSGRNEETKILNEHPPEKGKIQ
tara:strand:+ start:2150 stop:3349 length:1200 start_codon:yes stop_codon:yes gene_type:complete